MEFRKVKLIARPAVDPKTSSVDAFRACWNLINDPDVFQEQAGGDPSQRSHFWEYYQEAFEAYRTGGKAAYDAWWNKLSWRTDISDDMRFEFESETEWVDRMTLVYDNLHAQGLV